MTQSDSIQDLYYFSIDTTTVDTVETTEEWVFHLDSIFRMRDTVVPIQRTSLFEGHELASRHNLLIPRLADGSNMWLFGVIVAVLILLTVVLRTRRIKVGTLLQAGIIQRKMDMILREGAFTRFSTFLHGVLFFSLIAATLPYYLLQGRLNLTGSATTWNGVVEYVLMAGMLTVALLLRQGLTLWLGNVFNNKEAIRHYMGNTQIFLFSDTIVLLPFALVLFFSPLSKALAPVALSIAALLMLIRIIRGMIIILSSANDSKFYLFYYLCTVEIVPILIITKLLLS